MVRAWFCRDDVLPTGGVPIVGDSAACANYKNGSHFACFIFLYPLFNPQFTSYATIRERKQKLPSNELPIKRSIQIVRMPGYVTKQFHLQK